MGRHSFFPRGEGPLISILLPSRGRPQNLVKAIDSCVSLSENPNNLELILKIDDDDKETIKAVERLSKILSMKVFVSGRGRGYEDMHLWADQMSSKATGDWLLLFNDDARIIVEKWDSVIASMVPEYTWAGFNDVSYLLLHTKNRPTMQEFFLLRRKVFEILGHISPVPHIDGYIYNLMDFIKCAIEIKFDFVEHLSDEILDRTREEASSARQRDCLNESSTKRQAVIDASKLISHLECIKSSAVWKESLPPVNSFSLLGKKGESLDRNSVKIVLRANDGLFYRLSPTEKTKADLVQMFPANDSIWLVLSKFDPSLGRTVNGL